ncbi:hypothetical protein DHEL01_v204632 [Diaporthe helianthi]|uniref:Uncharacterized protein n=1 Tax=Diaporthe helianthi TaxID=158607 RepID=A0A2P5I391_DIAHE|nr:hypothetical protein DHEL01_v204632 [Diaporthe helianthi]
MADDKTELNDGGANRRLKYSNYIDPVPGVNNSFLNRCFNAADTMVYKSRGRWAAKRSRQTYETYLRALQKLARRVCLHPDERLRQKQIAEITKAREFLRPKFFAHMGFHGVDIVPTEEGVWTFKVSQSPEWLAPMLEIFID